MITRLLRRIACLAVGVTTGGAAMAASSWAPADWGPVDAAVRGQISAGKLPGAVAIVGDAESIVLRRAWGRRAELPRPEPMTLDTVFDLASLTKVVVTTTAVLQLAERGRVALDAPVARYWPAFGARGKAAITVRQLLAHSGGLPAGLPLQERWSGRAETLGRVATMIADTPPDVRTRYSDVGFIVLGELVRRVSGLALEAYARRHIFEAVGMRDTGFRPPAHLLARVAPTEMIRGVPLRGTAHDPTARRMKGIAGHAGLFGTADDLARFAQALLQPGRLLAPSSIAELQVLQGPMDGDAPRGLGWQLQAPWTANRDALPPTGAVAHTGYTGTGLWIDFAQRRFLVLLTNRLHPDGRGDARPLRRQVLALLSGLSPPRLPSAAVVLPAARGAIATGIDALRMQGYDLLSGLRIGLLTHVAAIDSLGWRTLDRLRWAPGVTVTKVFTPEHGFSATAEGKVPSGSEPFSGIPVVSLYGAQRRPSPEQLRDIDALVVDLQDAGARFYTYVATMADAMEAAAEQGVRIVVLDRPNPIGAERVAGPVLDPGRGSLTGYAGLPVQHGMTLGELARLVADDLLTRRGLAVELRVIAMQGYSRSMAFADTGLDWVPPSPNLRTPTTALLYPGVAWLEGANVSVGRGTAHPFELVGAPWIEADRLAAALETTRIPGVRFVPQAFTPDAPPFRGQRCQGVRIEVTDRRRLDAALLGAALAGTLQRLWPERFELQRIAALVGSDETMRGLRDGDAASAIAARWEDGLVPFRERRASFLIY